MLQEASGNNERRFRTVWMGFGSRFAGREAEDGGEVSEGTAGRRDLRSLSGGKRGTTRRKRQFGKAGLWGEVGGDAGGQPLPGNPEARTDTGPSVSMGRRLEV